MYIGLLGITIIYIGLATLIPNMKYFHLIPLPFYLVSFLYACALGITFFITIVMFSINRSVYTTITLLGIVLLLLLIGDVPSGYISFIHSPLTLSTKFYGLAYSHMFVSCIIIYLYMIIEYIYSLFVNMWQQTTRFDKWFFVGLSICIVLSTMYYGIFDKTIHIYDRITYWNDAANDSIAFKFPWHYIISDALFQDYRSIINIPIAILMKIFGTHRAIYQTILAITQLIPLIVIIGIFINKFSFSRNFYSLAFLITLLTPLPLKNVLLAFPFGSLAILSAVSLLAYYDENLPLYKRIVIFTASMMFIFVIKRWGLYASVGCCLVIFWNTLFHFNYKEIKNIKKLREYLSTPLLTVTYLCMLFFGLIGIKTINALLNTYNISYSAYKESFQETIKQFLDTIGTANTVLFVIGIIIAILSLRTRKYKINFSILLSLFIISALFYNIQSPDLPHYMIFYFFITFIIALPISYSYSIIEQKINPKARYIFLCLVASFAIYNNNKIIKPKLTSSLSISTYNKFFDYLQNNSSYFIVCVGNSSSAFINSILVYERLNKGNIFSNYTTSSRHIDLRDGLPVELLTSDIVITTKELRMCEKNQHIMSYPFEQFKNNTGIAKAFTLIDTLDNDGEITYIYQKTRAITPKEKEEFYNYFTTIYPNNPLFPKYINQ